MLEFLTIFPPRGFLTELLTVRLRYFASLFATDQNLFFQNTSNFTFKKYNLSFPDLLAIARQHPYLTRILDRALPCLQPLATHAELQELLAIRIAFAKQATDAFNDIAFSWYDLSYEQILKYIAEFPDSFDQEEIRDWLQTQEKQLDEQQRLALAKAMLLADPHLEAEALAPFALSQEQERMLVMDLLKRNEGLEEQRLDIDPSYMRLIPFAQRLQSYLRAVQNCSFKFVQTKDFCLVGADAERSAAVSQQNLQNPEHILPTRLIPLVERYVDIVVELIGSDFSNFKRQAMAILAEFNAEFNKAMPGPHLLTGSADKLHKAHMFAADHDDAMALLNMSAWFFYTSLRCVHASDDGLGVVRFVDISKRFPQHHRILQEIYNLAAPQDRFYLTDVYFACVNNPQGSQLLQDLIKPVPSRAVLPALVMTRTLVANALQAPDHKKRVVSLLKNIPNVYNDGANLRTLVQGLCAVCESNTVDLSRRLAVVERILAKDDLAYLELKPTEDLANHVARWQQQPNHGNRFLLVRQGDRFYFSGFSKDGVLLAGSVEDMQSLHPVASLLKSMCANGTKIKKATPNILHAIVNTPIITSAVERQLEQWLLCIGLAGTGMLQTLADADLMERNLFVRMFEECLSNTFDLSDRQLVIYKQNFAANPRQTALLAYHAKLSALPIHERKVFLDLLRSYVHGICSSHAVDYYLLRYNQANNRHLQAVFVNDAFMQRWILGASADFNQFSTMLPAVDFSQTKSQAIQKIKESILSHDSNKRLLPNLFQYFTASSQSDRNEAKQKLGDRNEPGVPIERQCIYILENVDKFSPRALLQQFSQLKTLLTKIWFMSMALKNTIAACIQVIDVLRQVNANFRTASNNHAGWIIADTDHPPHMLMLGTDVAGSCQSVDGNPRLNKCLIGGYVLSGHVRAIAILDPTGRIVARNILRLMFDKTSNKPVLFLEEIYPVTAPSVYRQAILTFAKMRALQLGCSLLAKGADNFAAVEYPNPIETLQINAAEYVDAIGGPQSAPYAISGAKVIFDPVIYAQQLTTTHARKAITFGEPVTAKLLYLQQAWQARQIKSITWQRDPFTKAYYPIKIKGFDSKVVDYAKRKQALLLLKN